MFFTKKSYCFGIEAPKKAKPAGKQSKINEYCKEDPNEQILNLQDVCQLNDLNPLNSNSLSSIDQSSEKASKNSFDESLKSNRWIFNNFIDQLANINTELGGKFSRFCEITPEKKSRTCKTVNKASMIASNHVGFY